jgi:hypothetical protein
MMVRLECFNFKKIKKQHMNRQEANRKILEKISAAIEDFPDLRFHQILNSLDVNIRVGKDGEDGDVVCRDLVHEESIETLKRMNS